MHQFDAAKICLDIFSTDSPQRGGTAGMIGTVRAVRLELQVADCSNDNGGG